MFDSFFFFQVDFGISNKHFLHNYKKGHLKVNISVKCTIFETCAYLHARNVPYCVHISKIELRHAFEKS